MSQDYTTRSSRRPPADEDEATRLEALSAASDDSKEVKFLQRTSTWRNTAIFFIVLSVFLIIGLLVLGSQHKAGGKDDVPLCGNSKNAVKRVIDMSEPDSPGPFHDLTKKELRAVVSFLQKDPEIQLKPPEKAGDKDSLIFMIDLLPAKKSEVKAFLDGKGRQPNREARVVLFRRDLDPPMIHELGCGPLPKVTSCPLIKSRNRRNPVEYSLRPLALHADYEHWGVFLDTVDKEIGYILRESYGMSYANCPDGKCLKMYPSPMGTNLAGNINHRRIWFSALYPQEYYGMHIVDFGVLANLDGADPSKYYISKIWYHGQYFDSVDDFIRQYNASSIAKSRLTPPSDDPQDSYSTLFLKGQALPETPQRPPTLTEPDGKRYSLKNREVEYLGWKFNFRLSALSGPALSNIRYRGDRIAYELMMNEIGVMYSGDNPLQRTTDYVDSGALLGTHAKSLVPGADCPETATFIPQTFPSQDLAEPVHIKRAFCLFENNFGHPIRRHLSFSQDEGAFYGGMQDSALILRTVLTVVNYDYVVDFIFHQSGAIQTRVMSTGYILPTFYRSAEDPYGFQTTKNFIANIHHHLFHFKVDLDISGTSNRYETLNINPESVKMRTPPHPYYYQTRIDRKLHRSEKDALFKFDFDKPKYHVVHNDAARSDLGTMRAYRIEIQGMSKHLVPEDVNNEINFSWARHQLAVTRQKDDEQLSSSPYGMIDSLRPVTNFTKFWDDDENIVDEDLVFWIPMGVHHIPHSEDLPITPTVGAHSTFFLLPFNYFPYCPSFSSRDHIRIQLKDNKNPKDGVKIDRNGYTDDQCRTVQHATAYDELLEEDPDVVLESRLKSTLF